MRMLRLTDLNRLASLNLSARSHGLASDEVASHSLVFQGVLGMGLISSFAGKLHVQVNDSAYTIDDRSFIVINRGSQVRLKTGDSACRPVVLLFKETTCRLVAAELFEEEAAKDLAPEQLLSHQLIEHIHYSNATLITQLRTLQKLAQSCASFQALKADALVRSIINSLGSQNYEAIRSSTKLDVKKQTTRTDLFRRLSVCKEWMEQHFREDIDMELLADMALMDKAHFSRNFKAAFELSPYQHLMNVRMEWASQQLTNSTDSVQSISETIGFETPSSFSYQFKRWKGMSPMELRKGLKSTF